MTVCFYCTTSAFVFSLILIGAAPASEGHIEDMLARTIIVRAHVIEVEGTEQYSQSTQQIDHVYCGRLPVGIATFIDSSAAQSSTGGPVWPALELEQEGIWLVRLFHDGQVYRKAIPELGIKWPVRPDEDENYEQVRMFAEAMESVWQAETEAERLDLLRGYAQSGVPEVAVGSIMILEEGAPDALEELVSEINLPELPLRAQIAIDAGMMKLQREQWQNAKQRQQLIAAWGVRAIEDEADTMLILQRLDRAIQRKQVESQIFFEFLRPIITGELRTIAKGEPHSLNVRTHALGMTRWIINEPVVRDDVFGLLVDILESDESDRLKNTAASVLRTVTTLKPNQIKYVSELRDHYAALAAETDDKHALIHRVAALLDETVNNLTPDE